MKTTHMWMVAGACVLALGASAPDARADDDKYAGGWGCGMGQGGHMRFAAVDQNGDGTIVADEAAAHAEQMFVLMDEDGGGDLTKVEFVEFHRGWGHGWRQWRNEAREERRRERFTAMDTDTDEKVTRAEFIAAAEEHFATADADDDGIVTPWEFRSRRRAF